MLLRALLAVNVPELPDIEDRLERLLRKKGFRPDRIRDQEALREPLSREDHDLVLIDTSSAAELMESIRQLPSPPAVVALTQKEDPEERAELLSAGCHAVLWLGLAERTLGETLFALANRRSEELLTHLGAQRRQKRSKLSDFVSASPSMIRLVDLAERVASSDSALLILGETGVGKERLARSIHFESDRSRGPSFPSTVARFRKACWKASSSVTNKVPSPVRPERGEDISSSLRVARSFSTRSARCRSTFR